MSKFKNITIALKPHVMDEFSVSLPFMVEYLLRHNLNVNFFDNEVKRIKGLAKDLHTKVNFISKSEVNKKSDLVIIFGGDGTLIGLCRDVDQLDAPIFGVNLGKLGFLTEFSKKDYMDELEKTLNGKYKTMTMKPHSVSIYDGNDKTFSGFFFNDMVIGKNSIARLIRISIALDDEHIFDIDGDGFIISTPQGSTAYSLSAGGPIIHPNVNALVLTPVCPHTLSSRPIVIPKDAVIKTSISEYSNEVVLTLDGQLEVDLKKTDVVKTQNPNHQGFKIISNPNKSYLANLREKFIQGQRF